VVARDSAANATIGPSVPLIAALHLCHLATTQVEAKLCAVEEDTFEVYLYATIKNEKVGEKCTLIFFSLKSVL
jgi:hypothetical protein